MRPTRLTNLYPRAPGITELFISRADSRPSKTVRERNTLRVVQASRDGAPLSVPGGPERVEADLDLCVAGELWTVGDPCRAVSGVGWLWC
jgi:hypothetical protein